MSGIITGPYFNSFFKQPSHFQLGNMVAILEIGALSNTPSFWSYYPTYIWSVTSLAAGRIGDILGRRRTLFLGACTFVVGGAGQTFSPNYGVLIMGRLVSGFGVGLLSWVYHGTKLTLAQSYFSTIVPIYQSEISPPNHVNLSSSKHKRILMRFREEN